MSGMEKGQSRVLTYIAMYWTMYGQQSGVIGLNSHQLRGKTVRM